MPGEVSPAAKGLTGAFNDEQKQAWAEKMRTGTPAERRDIINRLPEAVRDMTRQKMREQGLVKAPDLVLDAGAFLVGVHSESSLRIPWCLLELRQMRTRL